MLFCGKCAGRARYGSDAVRDVARVRTDSRAVQLPHGHEHHLRTINRIRAIGRIQQAVRSGVVTEGIMAACVRRNVKMVLAERFATTEPLYGVLTDFHAGAANRA